MDTVRVGGYPTVRATRREIAKAMADQCLRSREASGDLLPWMVFSSNGQGIALIGKNTKFDAAMQAADVIHADGMPVVLASRWLTRSPIAERSATTDLFHDVAEIAQEIGLRFFVLGGTEDLNERAVERMRELYPDLKIVGRHHGYFGEDEDAEICKKIFDSGADVLWVGTGKPRQEIWCHKNRELLRGVGCIKTCGGLFAFLTGDAPRAPEWMQRSGLEWLHRMLNNPRRLMRRYITTNVIASVRLIRHTG